MVVCPEPVVVQTVEMVAAERAVAIHLADSIIDRVLNVFVVDDDVADDDDLIDDDVNDE